AFTIRPPWPKPLFQKRYLQLGKHVGWTFDEGCAVAYQLMATSREGIVDRAGYREHLPPLLGRVLCRHQGAAAVGCLHYQRAVGKSADDAVTPWKVVAGRRGARWKF